MDAWRLPTGISTALCLLAAPAMVPDVPPVAAAAAGVFAWLLGMDAGRSWRRLASACLLAASAGLLRAAPDPPGLSRRTDAAVAGRIVDWEPTPWGIAAGVAVVQVNGVRRARPVTARVSAPRSWGPVPRSNWVSFRGDVVPAHGATNPGGWDGGEPAIRVRDSEPPRWGPGSPGGLHAVRARVSRDCRGRLRGFPGRFAEAVLLGRSRALLPEERRVFRGAGASHLVAVSGLHVGLAAMIASLLLGAAPRAVRIAGVTGAAGAYALLAGASPSAVRAAAWIGAAALGAGLRRPRPAAAWLALVLPWLVVASPELVRSVSFRLSIGAVGGILFAAELAGAFRGWKRAVAPVAASLGAQWGTLPVIAAAFGQLAPAATLPNLAAIPLTGLFLPAVLLAAVTRPIPALSELFLDAARVLGLAVLGVLKWSDAHLPLWTGLPPAPTAVRVLFPGLLLVWFSLPRSLRRRRSVRFAGLAAGALLAAAVLVPRSPRPGPWAAFLDVGQGDAAVLRLSDGTVWVVDVGDDRGPGDAARNALLPFLRTRGVRSVDGLVLSHRHRDHVGALAAFLEGIPVRRVYDAGFGGDAGTPAWVDSVLGSRGLWPCLVAAGDTLHAAGGATLVALAPARGDPAHPPPSLNDASLVVRVADGPLTVLFAGDAERGEEAACLRGPGVRAVRILKVGHHGSDTSTSPDFLSAASPDWGIISCGEGNSFRHPRAVTLDRLGCRGVRVLRTDRDGGIEVVVRAGTLAVTTYPPRLP